MKRWFVPGFLLVIAVALALRLPALDLRPLHNDEGVNTIKFRDLWDSNSYKYNPNEFHGPTLPYFTLPAAWVSHDFNDITVNQFRLAPVLFGTGLIVLLLLLTPDYGREETLWAALLTAVSPAMVFYSRYYIHEMLLVFFTALAGLAWWRHGRTGQWGWALLAGAGFGLMAATKETFVISLLAAALAVGGVALMPGQKSVFRWTRQSAGVALGLAAVVAALFFTSFLSNFQGLVGAVKTYAPWTHRAEGVSVHVHPWNFYFERLLFYRASGGPVWTEALIAGLAVIGGTAALRGRGLGATNTTLARFLAIYTGVLILIYTVVPYKTPWCLLGFLHGLILLGSIGAAVLMRLCKPMRLKAVMMLLLAGATAQLAWQAWRMNFASDKSNVPYCDTVKCPYTYSQTSPDIFRLMETIDSLAHVSPSGYGTIIEVMSPESYWPLPWYLRRYTAVGYFDRIPDQPLAPIMIVSTALHAGFDERPEKSHLMAGYFQLRPGVFLELYVNVDLWAHYLRSLPPQSGDAP